MFVEGAGLGSREDSDVNPDRPEITHSWVDRYPDGRMVEVSLSISKVFPDETSSQEAIKSSNLTTGRRSDLEKSLREGVEVFGTPINETISEVPSVFCGKTGDNLLSSESFRRSYGDIYAPDSEGYVLLMRVPESDPAYVDNGIEAQITRNVEPGEITGIVVGNDQMYEQAAAIVTQLGLGIAVIESKRTETTI